jgi:hypothetical protein
VVGVVGAADSEAKVLVAACCQVHRDDHVLEVVRVVGRGWEGVVGADGEAQALV